MRAHHSQIALNRPDDRQTRELVASVVARAGLLKEVIERVIDRTDGVPLFAEELTQLILDSDGRTEENEIPNSLQDR